MGIFCIDMNWYSRCGKRKSRSFGKKESSRYKPTCCIRLLSNIFYFNMKPTNYEKGKKTKMIKQSSKLAVSKQKGL